MRTGFLPITDKEYREPDALPSLAGEDTVFLDTETTGLSWVQGDRPVGIGVAGAGATSYLPFGHRSGGGNLPEETVREWARRELRNKRVIGLNVKFDAHMMRAWGVDLAAQGCTFHDVAHDAALLDDERTSFSLEDLAQDYLSTGKLKDVPRAGIADLPAWAVRDYAVRDVDLTKRLYDRLLPDIKAEGLESVSRLEDDIILVCLEMEQNGMPLDLQLLAEWDNEAEQIAERLGYEIWKAVGFTVNPDAPTEMARLFAHQGVDVQRTAAGRPSFTGPIVQEAAAKSRAIELAWRLGKLHDLRSKYLTKYLKDHVGGKLYPTLNQLKVDDGGTVSGRFSCVRPNLQQVMGKDKHSRAYGWLREYSAHDFLIKRLFVPEHGVWCSADMKQVEYRVFAHYTNSEDLIGAYGLDPNTDFHNIVGDMIRPVRPDITRTEIKVVNFLTIFGGGPGAVARQLNVDRATAEELFEAYHRQFPEAGRLLRKAETIAKTRRFVKTILGRRSRFVGRSKDRTHKALNAIVQGTAADINKLKLRDIYAERKTLGITMRMTVHDSLEVDLHDMSTLRNYERALAEQAFHLSVPILWDVKTGQTWGDC